MAKPNPRSFRLELWGSPRTIIVDHGDAREQCRDLDEALRKIRKLAEDWISQEWKEQE